MFEQHSSGSVVNSLLLFSDFSESTTHETASFLIVNADDMPGLLGAIQTYRASSDLRWRGSEGTAQDRHIEYKKLNDKIRRASLPGFIRAVAELPAVLITFSISKRALDAFEVPVEDRTDPDLWKSISCFDRSIRPRLSRVVYLAALLSAGFGRHCHSVHWVCDRDDLTASDRHQEALALLTQNAVWAMLESPTPELTICTDAEEADPVLAEDFICVCDIAAGAYAALEAIPLLQVHARPDGMAYYPNLDYSHKSTEVLELFRLLRGKTLVERMVSIDLWPLGPGYFMTPKSFEV